MTCTGQTRPPSSASEDCSATHRNPPCCWRWHAARARPTRVWCRARARAGTKGLVSVGFGALTRAETDEFLGASIDDAVASLL